jgi:porphobilinogen synthase
VAEQCLSLGVPVMALFPVIDPALKTPDGREASTPKAWCRARCAS